MVIAAWSLDRKEAGGGGEPRGTLQGSARALGH